MSPIVSPGALATVVGSRAAIKILEHVLQDRAAARQADTRQAQLDHERRVRELEEKLDGVVRTLTPRARREYERERQLMERDHGPERKR